MINDLAIQLANKTIECANYKALYEEAQLQLQQLQEEKETKNNKANSIVSNVEKSSTENSNA